ncbi:9099_t:CDS:2 [Paraglomus occultum]|uniref:9099_t:CDS:1 n=1 Tax=Paraglomus occultum TaxID=144539 RepID=A0A9N8Z4L6_9GLOM|nr:9099_t:CDS:2 [Paraglomus occultum]
MSRAWSPKEVNILVSFDNGECGRRMKAFYLSHKTAKQCADKLKDIRGYVDRPFTPFECDMIRQLYRKHGPRWRRMSAILHRSPQMIMECWFAMDEEAKRIRKKMAVQRLLS